MNIADRIQHLRKTKGISQEELADQIGVSRQAVSKWESEQSIPDIDKVIVISDFFDVSTDYLLKGIEPTIQADKEPTNASIFTLVATMLNFMGLVVACAIWYEQQVSMALAIGLIIIAVGCMLYGIGQSVSTHNLAQARRSFWAANIWLLTLIPLSVIYNALLGRTIAPYPLLANPLIALPIFWLVYLAICGSVTISQLRRKA